MYAYAITYDGIASGSSSAHAKSAAARKAAARDEPAGGRAAHRDAGADEHDEQQRVADVARQHGAGEVHPRVAGAEREPAPDDGGDRQHGEQLRRRQRAR